MKSQVTPGEGYIPLDHVKDQLAAIDARLAELQAQTARISDETAVLNTRRTIFLELQKNAVTVTSLDTRKAPPPPPGFKPGAASASAAQSPSYAEQMIPDGRIATPIILAMIRERPGVRSGEVVDLLLPRVTKKSTKGPRRFLSDLIWELGHRKKLRREPDGRLYLVEQGGDK